MEKKTPHVFEHRLLLLLFLLFLFFLFFLWFHQRISSRSDGIAIAESHLYFSHLVITEITMQISVQERGLALGTVPLDSHRHQSVDPIRGVSGAVVE